MKWTRIFIWGVAILLALLAIGLGGGSLWLDSFIHSDAFRHDVEARVGKTMGATIEIRQIDFGILRGVELKGLGTKMVTAQGTVVSEVAKVRCSYSLGALLDRKLQLDGVTVEEPRIVLTQLPPSKVPEPVAPALESNDNPTPEQTKSGKTAPFEVILKAAKVKNGRLSLQDAAGATQADLQGLQMTADTEGYFVGKDVSGELSVATITLPNNLVLTDFSTPFRYRTNLFEASPYKVSVLGGQANGDYRVDPSGPSVLEVNATGIDLAAAEKIVAPDLPTKLSGTLASQSKWTSVEKGKLTGEGDAQMVAGKLTGQPILRDLAKALQIPEMRNPEIKSFVVHFRVANGTIRFSEFLLKSAAFEMAGSGVIDPRGNLTANMTLVLYDTTLSRIPPVVAPFFAKVPGGGSIPFQLTGTALNPESDSLTKNFIQGSKVNESIKKTLNKFFH